MKPNILVIISTLLILVSCIVLKAENTETVNFITSGNCIVCEVRIEEAVKKLSGISYVYWDPNTKIAMVTYDTTKTDVYEIMKKIASVGHDTEWFQGDNEKYAGLIGTCCEYPRTIDYNTAKIGYLSLMDKWVSVQTKLTGEIKLFSVNNGNALNYNITNYDLTQLKLKIYSLSGVEVYSNSNLTSSGTIDLSSFYSGTYFAILTNQNKIIFNKKIIK